MKVLVPVADGSEDIETVVIVDVLRRAEAEVTLASVAPEGRLEVTAARRTRIVADRHIEDCAGETFDLIALPGGLPGAENLRDCAALIDMLGKQKREGKWYAAICAAPAVVLHHHGLLDGPATAHPGFVDKLDQPSPEAVVVHGNCITSQAPGTALAFALTLVEKLYGDAKRDELATQMVVERASAS